MFVPGISPPRKKSHSLERRKGGGGRGGGSRPAGGSSSSNSNGVSRVTTIPLGQPFAGRQQGGGTRQQIYGTPIYGSGYPAFVPVSAGAAHYGTRGLGFPFFFWPLAWGGVAGYAGASYMYNNEYGSHDNTSRPGGVMQVANYPSPNTNATYRVVADQETVKSLIESIASNCSSIIASNSSTSPSGYDPNASSPKPEQAVQYYRASSLALTLDGYNNSLAENSTDPPSPLPPWNDQALLDCLNYTIGTAAPLIDGAAAATPSLGLVGLVGIVWLASSIF